MSVPALVGWHEHHLACRDEVAAKPALICHVALETYAVLTRLPSGRRVSGPDVAAMLSHNFAEPWLALAAERYSELLSGLASAGYGGGAAYDALIGLTAAAFDATLVSLDRRAMEVYAAMGARVDSPYR